MTNASDATATRNDALVSRARQYTNQLEAHMDEGGATTDGNVRDLIRIVRDLCGDDGVPLSSILGWRPEHNGGDVW